LQEHCFGCAYNACQHCADCTPAMFRRVRNCTFIVIIFYTLGIKDPEGFGDKNYNLKMQGVTLKPGSHRQQKSREV